MDSERSGETSAPNVPPIRTNCQAGRAFPLHERPRALAAPQPERPKRSLQDAFAPAAPWRKTKPDVPQPLKERPADATSDRCQLVAQPLVVLLALFEFSG